MTHFRTLLGLSLLVSTLISVAGCGGGGAYGFARSYQPLDEERELMERAAERSYEEVRRTRPEEQQLVGWFGVVVDEPMMQPDGRAFVLLSLRAHQDRHLCGDEGDDSCRVTVSHREIGRFNVLLPLREDERAGPRRLWTGSLVKVYGVPTGQDSGPEQGLVVEAQWHRHWPPHYYVTTASAGRMRR